MHLSPYVARAVAAALLCGACAGEPPPNRPDHERPCRLPLDFICTDCGTYEEYRASLEVHCWPVDEAVCDGGRVLRCFDGEGWEWFFDPSGRMVGMAYWLRRPSCRDPDADLYAYGTILENCDPPPRDW